MTTSAATRLFLRPVSRRLAAYAFLRCPGLLLLRDFLRDEQPAVARLDDPVEAARSHGAAVQAGECILLLLSEGSAGYAELESTALSQHVAGVDGARPLRPDLSELGLSIATTFEFDTSPAACWSTRLMLPRVGVWWLTPLCDAALVDLRESVPELIVASAHASCYARSANLYFVIAAQPPRQAEGVERVYWSIWTSLMRLGARRDNFHHHGISRVQARWLPSEQLGIPTAAAHQAGIRPVTGTRSRHEITAGPAR